MCFICDWIRSCIFPDLANTTDPTKGDALIGFRQSGAGAVSRTVHDKLAEAISVLDYGATGDGATDDTTAIRNALAASSPTPTSRQVAVYFPSGTYIVSEGIDITSRRIIGEPPRFGGQVGGSIIKVANSVAPFPGGVLNSFGVDYAPIPRVGGGMFRSTNNGDRWTAVDTGSTNTTSVLALAINSSGHIFAGAMGVTVEGTLVTLVGKVLRSRDNGDSWDDVHTVLRTSFFALAINSRGDIFAGTSSRGVFRSMDNGESWEPVNNGLTNTSVLALAINSSGDIFAGTRGDGVFRWRNDGDRWEAVNTDLTNTSVFALAINLSGPMFAGHIFAGTYLRGVFRSRDNGDSWTAVNAGLTDTNVFALAINSSEHIFAGTQRGGVFRSTNNGDSWEAVNNGLTNTSVFALAINSNGDIFAGTRGGGVFRSMNNGDRWDAVNSDDLTNAFVQSLAINSSGHIFAGTIGGCDKPGRAPLDLRHIQLDANYKAEYGLYVGGGGGQTSNVWQVHAQKARLDNFFFDGGGGNLWSLGSLQAGRHGIHLVDCNGTTLRSFASTLSGSPTEPGGPPNRNGCGLFVEAECDAAGVFVDTGGIGAGYGPAVYVRNTTAVTTIEKLWIENGTPTDTIIIDGARDVVLQKCAIVGGEPGNPNVRAIRLMNGAFNNIVRDNFIAVQGESLRDRTGQTTGDQIEIEAGCSNNHIENNLSARNSRLGVPVISSERNHILGQRQVISYGTAAPTSGRLNWERGDIVWNSLPVEAGSAGNRYVILGWVCVATGTPGTWVEMRASTGN